jgi:hypothetical protein
MEFKNFEILERKAQICSIKYILFAMSIAGSIETCNFSYNFAGVHCALAMAGAKERGSD